MDFTKLPIGFALALSQNAAAMSAYSAMTEAQKQEVLQKAQQAGSNAEMHRIVAALPRQTIS